MIDLEMLISKNRKYTCDGKVASYIPELSYAPKDSLGMAVYDIENNILLTAGDYKYRFTAQSIAKVIILACAIIDKGTDVVFSKVGLKPSSDPFNSILKLETMDDHRPLNPFINAGAISCTVLCNGNTSEEIFTRVFTMFKEVTNNKNLIINEKVYLSEAKTGDNNRALAYFMKGSNIIDSKVDINVVLDAYFKICSIEVDVCDLAHLAAILANKGVAPWNNKQYFSKKLTNLICTLMYTCGLYDYSGEFAIKVGLPSKSGVGGGIMSVLCEKYGIAVCGPALDSHGNSCASIEVLSSFVEEINYQMF